MTTDAAPQLPIQPVTSSRRIIRSLKVKADARRTFAEKVADWTTAALGSMPFLMGNIIWFLAWISLNTRVIPGIEPFDPFPFSLLTTVVSLEAIILAIIVLISQNRAAKIDDLREEIDLQVDIITEEELTKLMRLMVLLLEKEGVSTEEDKALQSMLRPTNLEKIERALARQVVENGK